MFENIRRYIPETAKIKILENTVEPEIQIEYFHYAMQVRNDKEIKKAIDKKENLLSNEISIEQKRKLLVLLAASKDVESYRILEKYAKNPDEQLKYWSIIAKNEAEITIHNYLLDEQYAIIGSGLGGKGNKLRFVVILITRNKTKLTDFQKERITKELEFNCTEDCVIEKINFGDYFVSVVGLFPFDDTIQNFFDSVVDNVNELGNFLDDFYIISNIKEYSNQEIINLIKEIEEKSKKQYENMEFGDFGDVIDDDIEEDDYDDEEDEDDEYF